MIPEPHVLQQLTRSRLVIGRAKASVGIGERRSHRKGAGMEFADHREYVAGDDLRHLDPHVYARLGQHVVRQYEVHMQLPVTIVVDASRSMAYGAPTKLDVSRWLANTLAFVALAGGDRARIGVWTGERLDMSSFHQGASQSQKLFAWLASRAVEGDKPFGEALGEVSRITHARGLTIILSDWWIDGWESSLTHLAANQQEIWALQVVAPEELDPELLGSGDVRLLDAESGAEVELSLAGPARDEYVAAVAGWTARLRGVLHAIEGQHLQVRTDQPLVGLVQTMRRMAMIG